MAFTGPMEDRQLIRERIDSYADAVFRRDCEDWLANWCEDCAWTVFGSEVRGKATLRERWPVIWKAFDRMTFFTQVGAIEVEGDRAKVRSYCREIVARRDGGLMKVSGAYSDELVRENGIWLFARRDYEVLIDEDQFAAE